MQYADIKDFVKEVLGPNTYVEKKGGWASLHCPFARWRHERGTDSSPSAGISISDDTSIFHCYACKSKGPMPWFLRTLSTYTGEEFGDLLREVEQGAFLGGHLREWGDDPATLVERKPALDEAMYGDLFDPAAGHPYLRKRGITDKTAAMLELGVDVDNRNAERIVFPVRGPDGALYGFSGRAVEDGVDPRVKDYFGLPKQQLLLGAHLIAPTDRYILLSEGLFDFARLRQYRFPAVSSMMSNLVEWQAEILRAWGKPVYMFYDRDAAGDKGKLEVINMLIDHVPVLDVVYPTSYVYSVEGKRRLVKDPDELTRAEVMHMIDAATLV